MTSDPSAGDKIIQSDARGLAEEPVLERDGELAALTEALVRAGAGLGSMTVICGPAGVGKSTLLRAASERAASGGLTVLNGRGLELERDFPFGVVLQIFEPQVDASSERESRELFAGSAGLTRSLLDVRSFEPAGGQHLFPLLHRLYWLAASAARRNPLVLAIDDAQWADEPSLRFLSYLAQRVEDLPAAVLIAHRRGERGEPSALISEIEDAAGSVLLLQPLSREAVAKLVRQRLGASAAPEFARATAEVTGGNPFFVRELLSEVERRHLAPSEEAARGLGELAPSGVLRAIARRLGRLPDACTQLARAVAVLGGAPLAEAARLAQLDADNAARAADELAGAGVLVPGRPLRILHPLVRSAIEADIGAGERAILHARAARLVADCGGEPGRVAAHLLQAEPAGEVWVVQRLRESASRAMSAGVPASAVTYLRRALNEPPEPAERAGVLRELAHADAASGDPQAVDRLREAVTLSPAGDERACALGELGQLLYVRGELSQAAEAFDRALQEADPDHTSLRSELEAGWITVARLEGKLRPQAVARLRPLIERAGPATTHSERALLAQVAGQLVFAGKPREQGVALARRALAGGLLLREETSDGINWIPAAEALRSADYLDEYHEVCEAALEDAHRRGSVLGFATAVYGRSYSHYFGGRLRDAMADLQAALDARRYGWEQFRAAAVAQHACALLDAGEPAKAAEVLEPEIAEPGASSEPMQAQLLEARARLRLRLGDPEGAYEDAKLAGRKLLRALIPNPAILPWREHGAMAAAALGRHTEAAELAHDAIALARRFGAPRAMGMALLSAGVVARREDRQIKLLSDAVEILGASPAELELARALVELGSALRRHGKRQEAREPLVRALDMASRFDATALAEQAREELRQAGYRPRRAAMTGATALTPAELRVAQLAGQGLPNPEIAQSLFVSLRTVETHLTSAYRKLGITSRRELGPALSEE